MPSRIGGPSTAPNLTPADSRPAERAPQAPNASTNVARADAFDARDGAARGPSARGPSVGNNDFVSLVSSLQPKLHTASHYEAHFGMGPRGARAVVEGQGTVELPTGTGRGPSFLAEAGKPLVVTVDPARIFDRTEKVELVWRLVPHGEEQVVPLSDGTRDPSTGKLNLSAARIDVPEDATGLIRLSLRTHTADGRVSNQWDPSNDAAIASREGATIVFSEDWKTQVGGKLRAGDKLQLAYDLDRMSSLFGGGAPQNLTACVSFDGEPPLEFPLTVQPGEGGRPGQMFMPSLRIPFEATQVSIWFKGQDGGRAEWDSAMGQNFKFEVGPARDDADPSWKAEMLRSRSFPNLTADKFVGIGPSNQRYNCIAWTLGIRNEWVWPGTRVEDFDALYAKHGYRPLDTLDLSHDPSLEKVVIYGLKPRSGTGPIEVTHGARMDEEGRWTSKIGTQPLIRHNSPEDLSGPSYGEPIRVYVRPRPESPS